jgi:hypothetical protein
MVEVFSTTGPVISRIGTDALIEIPSLDDPDVDKFIKGIIAYVQNPAVDVAGLVTTASNTTDEPILQDFFPFTENAIDALKSHLTQIMTPREITMKMTRALGRAYRANSPAITSIHIV